jgi:hypothetical protein
MLVGKGFPIKNSLMDEENDIEPPRCGKTDNEKISKTLIYHEFLACQQGVWGEKISPVQNGSVTPQGK